MHDIAFAKDGSAGVDRNSYSGSGAAVSAVSVFTGFLVGSQSDTGFEENPLSLPRSKDWPLLSGKV